MSRTAAAVQSPDRGGSLAPGRAGFKFELPAALATCAAFWFSSP